MKQLVINPEIGKEDIAKIHEALKILQLDIDEQELLDNEYGISTENAVREFQKKHNIAQSGKISSKTLSIINIYLFDNYCTKNEARLKELYLLLEMLGYTIPSDEKQDYIFGSQSRSLIKDIQKQYRVKPNGLISERFYNILIEKKLIKQFERREEIRILHDKLLSFLQFSNIKNVIISPEEYYDYKFGKTTSQAILIFQHVSKLPQTGLMDFQTLNKLDYTLEEFEEEERKKEAEKKKMEAIFSPLGYKMFSENNELLREINTSLKNILNDIKEIKKKIE